MKGAKIYHLKESGAAEGMNNLVTYKRVAYKDISTERLLLDVFVSLQPMDRDATVTKLYFQNVKVGGFPVHLQTFGELRLKALTLQQGGKPLLSLVGQNKITITGESFVQVKLNAVQKLFVRSKDVVVPVKFKQDVPLEMFPDSPLLKLAATKVLDALSDPTTSAAIALAKEHVQKLERDHALESVARNSLYLLYCEYVLKNPQTGASEKFAQSGTGFVVSADGKLLTSKRAVQPWKSDPQVAYLIEKYHLEVDPAGYKLAAWAAGAEINLPEGQPNFQAALTQEQKSLEIVKVAPDRMEKTEYLDPDTGESATVSVDAGGADDWALLQLHGEKFQPLPLAEATEATSPSTLLAFPYGLSQPTAEPKLVETKAVLEKNEILLSETLDPGETGAPLVNGEGKVVGLAGGSKNCVPVEVLRGLLP